MPTPNTTIRFPEGLELTPAQVRVWDARCLGLRDKDVARVMGCSWKLIETHRYQSATRNGLGMHEMLFAYMPIFLRRWSPGYAQRPAT